MTRTRFHEELEELKGKLLRMAGLAEQAVDRAVAAYAARDPRQCELVFAGEPAINACEREIDEVALDLLAMQQPMAVDLRFILAVIKINADLERVGDQAVNIVQRVQAMLETAGGELPVDVPVMGQTASKMIHNALQAFVFADAASAEQVLTMDDEVDRMNREIEARMLDVIQKNPAAGHQALETLLIARNLERVADHATNIAEDVIFWLRGADVRHGGSHTAMR